MSNFTSVIPFYFLYITTLNSYFTPQENSRRAISPLSTVFPQLCLQALAAFPICWSRPSSLRRSYGTNTKHTSAQSFLSSVHSCGSWQKSSALCFDSQTQITIPALLFLPTPPVSFPPINPRTCHAWVLYSHSFSDVTIRHSRVMNQQSRQTVRQEIKSNNTKQKE